MTYLFLDLETTGLDPDLDVILEIGLVVADEHFREIDSLSVLIHYGIEHETVVGWLDDTVREMHTKSGLLADLERAGLGHRTAAQVVTGWVNGHFPPGDGHFPGDDPIIVGGSGIDRFDIPFLRADDLFAPLVERFHFRTFDTSGTRALMKLAGAPIPEQSDAHRAVPDARWSLAVARAALDIFTEVSA